MAGDLTEDPSEVRIFSQHQAAHHEQPDRREHREQKPPGRISAAEVSRLLGWRGNLHVARRAPKSCRAPLPERWHTNLNCPATATTTHEALHAQDSRRLGCE